MMLLSLSSKREASQARHWSYIPRFELPVLRRTEHVWASAQSQVVRASEMDD
ncbi:hypothetical protein BDZ91DRAFT_452899 [Kalaharituber pfeilii]|nr:hypothetical protein BDZ91DRAFT_452899 [Kalaharituber pfeilii]